MIRCRATKDFYKNVEQGKGDQRRIFVVGAVGKNHAACLMAS
jgi:hypothetical protein